MSDRLKRAVIKEELVELTGNYVDAILLNQFIYWSERVTDFDQFIREEKERASLNDIDLNIEPANGWIYKKAEDLAEETMLNMSKSNMMTHIKTIVKAGWVEQRRNPKNKMDKTYQYRVDIVKIQRDLARLGFALEGYRVPLDLLNNDASSKTELRSSETELRSFDSELRSTETEPRSSETEQQYQRLHTETTTEITQNNNNTVAAVQKEIELCLGTPISSLVKLLPDWIAKHGEDRLIELARYIGSTPGKWDNIVGSFRTAVTELWEVQAQVVAAAAPVPKSKVRDERYSAFYELYPDA